MSVFLITYNLFKPGQNHKQILDEIKTYNHCQLSESAYAIISGKNSEELFAIFKPLLDSNDELLVIPLQKKAAGQSNQKVNDWVMEYLYF
jgi:hypothetical protein